MLVPETAMHHHNLAATWEDEVGPSWKIATVETEAVAESVGDTPYIDLWSGVFAADRRHCAATRIKDVGKGSPRTQRCTPDTSINKQLLRLMRAFGQSRTET